MSGNNQPQFTRQANIGSALVTAANTNSDGTGNISTPTMYIVVTADANNGTYVEGVRIMTVANAAATATAATVIRLYLSNVTTGATTSANTFLIDEVAVPAGTADQTTTANPPIDVPLGFRIPAGWTLLASSHIAANASTGYRVTGFAGDY